MNNNITLVTTQKKFNDIPYINQIYKIKKISLIYSELNNPADLESNSLLEEMDIDILNFKLPYIDLIDMTTKISKYLIKEAKSSNEIIVKLSNDNGILNMALFYAACYNKKNIKSVIIYDTNLHKILHLPLFDFKLSDAKKVILKNIQNGKNSIEDIAKAVGRSNSMVYNHIRDLKDMGFIEKDSLKINNAAEIILSLENIRC